MTYFQAFSDSEKMLREGDVMGQIFDFSGIEKSEKSIKRTWEEFREALAKGDFLYDDIESAKSYTFLKVYDDLFNQHGGITYYTITIKELKDQYLGRGTILRENEVPDYMRFIPKKEFIEEDNRFSPPGIEWLYLAIGNDKDIHKCAQSECRAKSGQRFGFCHFSFDDRCNDLRLVDLTITDDTSFDKINQYLEDYGQKQVKKGIKRAKALGFIPKYTVGQDEFKHLFIKWVVYTYTKLLSEQIFEPLSVANDKSIMYAPFQTMAQYYISLNYSGIVYGSTVSEVGKNIVLFDKEIAHPKGMIEDYMIL